MFHKSIYLYLKISWILKTLNRKNKTPINEAIKSSDVMLINDNGEKIGIVSIEEALKKAKSKSLDLVQVSPSDAKPVVCKILDYGKHLFNKKKAFLLRNQKPRKPQLKKLNLDLQLIQVII